MGVTKAAIKELEDATSALWGAMRDIREYRAAPAWKQREQAPDLARAQAQATEARRTIDELKRRYGIEMTRSVLGGNLCSANIFG
jgi:hypothetical protein